MLISLFVILAVVGGRSQPTSLNITAAIQIQNQSFFSYLPYFDTCSYNNTNIVEGQINLIQINPKSMYYKILETGIVAFWSPVFNGLDIALALDSQPIPYVGYILYNSIIYNENRQLIFFNLTNNGFMFYYTLLTVQTQTLQLNYSTKRQLQIELPNEAYQIVQNCTQINKSNFAFIGNSSFLFVCGQLSQGFVFFPIQGLNPVIMLSFVQLGNNTYQLATNAPELDDFQQNIQPLWQAALYTDDRLYFIIYDDGNITISDLRKDKKILQLIVNRLWGQQAHVQFRRLMDLYNSFIVQEGLYFPGNITSIFISSHQNIFVESITEIGISYLCVFNSKGQIYWNISFNGSVIYFGNQISIIYDEEVEKVFKVQISRPIYIINPSYFNQTVPNNITPFSFVLQCQWVDIEFNYQILWTTTQFPSAYIKVLDDRQLFANDSIYAVQTMEKYLIIGPDFHIEPVPAPGMQIFIINSKNVIIDSRAIAVYDINLYSKTLQGIIIVTNNKVIYVTINGDVGTLVDEPCGFTSISSAKILKFGQCYIKNSQGQVCYCYSDFTVCQIVSNQSQIQSAFVSHPQNKPFIGQNPSQNDNTANNIPQNTTVGGVEIKKNLYDLIDRGLIISILQNNNVIVFDFATRKVYYKMTFECPATNSTNGIIFVKQFYRPSLILYCLDGYNLSQYTVQLGQLVFQRIIPLYGFRTTHRQENIQKTQAFVFLQVRPIHIKSQYDNCCILRLDPSQFTVSVILQVIDATFLLQTASYVNYDLVIMQRLLFTSEQTLINIYIPNQWIQFNQTNNQELVVKHDNVFLFFRSPVYNFFSLEVIEITFNLTSANLNLLPEENNSDIIYFKAQNFQKIGLLEYRYIFSYDMRNFVCGPIFNSLFYKNPDDTQGKVGIQQTDSLLRIKVIGRIGINFIQFIDPQDWNQPNLSLNNLILFISQDRMYVYAKQFNYSQMIQIYSFKLPEESCTYYLYQILNQTAANLTSNCLGLNQNFQTPLLTINYMPSINSFTSSSSFMGFSVALRSIETIRVNESLVYITGVLEGPSSTQTGRLVICSYLICSPLYISTNLQFLVDYASYQGQNQLYFVLAIGTSIIDVFINPTIESDSPYINPNYTISYIDAIDQPYCSKIVILNANETSSQILLSGSQFYYNLLITYSTSEIVVLNKYNRYSQCNLYDQFKPEYIYNNYTLQMFFVQCRQNDYKTTLQNFIGVKTLNAIYTGYLQIYTKLGPSGPNCSYTSTSPIRIIPISTSMDYPLFMAYQIDGVNKFIYEQIGGIIVDNLVQIYPTIKIFFRPISDNFTFPSVQFFVYNQFHSQLQTIRTMKNINPPFYYPVYFMFGLFVLANIITLVFLICYYKKGQRKMRRDVQYQDQEYREDGINYFQPTNSVRSSKYSVQPNRSSVKSQLEVNNKPQPFQIEMFFYKPDDRSSQRRSSLITEN